MATSLLLLVLELAADPPLVGTTKPPGGLGGSGGGTDDAGMSIADLCARDLCSFPLRGELAAAGAANEAREWLPPAPEAAVRDKPS